MATSSSGAHLYGQDIYETKEETETVTHADGEDVDEEQDEKDDKVAAVKVRKEEVWRDLFLTSNGRDKALVRQYRPSASLYP